MKNKGLFLVLLILLCNMSFVSVYATDSFEVTLSSENIEGTCGDIVTVPVYIDSSAQIMSAVVQFKYDETALEYVPYEKAYDKGTLSFSITSAALTQADSSVIGSYFAATKNINGNGTLIKLRFRIKEGAAPGTYPISYVKTDVMNIDEQYASVRSVNGSVTVSGSTAVMGDVDSNGKINVQDAVSVLKYVSGVATLEGESLRAADVTGDGKVEVADAAKILKYIARIIDNF